MAFLNVGLLLLFQFKSNSLKMLHANLSNGDMRGQLPSLLNIVNDTDKTVTFRGKNKNNLILSRLYTAWFSYSKSNVCMF